MYSSYHEIINTCATDSLDQEKVTIVGNICESGDVFARDRLMPKIEEGDVLAIMNAGAYGFSMASNYNLRPLPAELLLTENMINIIRRRQTFDDMFNTETK